MPVLISKGVLVIEEHPIEQLMDTAMSKIKEMVDVNTIVGDPVETVDGTVIIPISRVCFGFAAGGGNMEGMAADDSRRGQHTNNGSFAGGSGGGVMLNPMAFLVVNQDQVRLLPVNSNATMERLINVAPELLKEIKTLLVKNKKPPL